MRLWSLHPRHLDAKGLVALWREALLARAVLRGKTRGYRHHPQLARFQAHPSPRLAISAYLAAVYDEATARGYAFDRSKIGQLRRVTPIAVTRGQLAYEFVHLKRKLAGRAPGFHKKLGLLKRAAHHPLFRTRAGPVAAWEKKPER